MLQFMVGDGSTESREATNNVFYVLGAKEANPKSYKTPL